MHPPALGPERLSLRGRMGAVPRSTLRSGGEVKEEMMDSYRCGLCGYVYNPRAGDPGNNIGPRTEFGDLPETWACSRCGAEKNLFKKI